MLRYMLVEGGDPKTYLLSFLFCLPVMLLSLSLHESAHGFIAYKCGDSTAHNFGRITLNPLKHLDPMGFLCMALVGFGWAKPVPVNSRLFNNHRRGMMLTSLAGPISNLLLGFLFAVIYRFTAMPLVEAAFTAQTEAMQYIWYSLYLMLFIAIDLNVTLALFNLLPIPPLDGSKILFTLLPYKVYYKIMPYEKYITIGFMILLLTNVLSPLLNWGSGLIKDLFFLILF